MAEFKTVEEVLAHVEKTVDEWRGGCKEQKDAFKKVALSPTPTRETVKIILEISGVMKKSSEKGFDKLRPSWNVILNNFGDDNDENAISEFQRALVKYWTRMWGDGVIPDSVEVKFVGVQD